MLKETGKILPLHGDNCRYQAIKLTTRFQAWVTGYTESTFEVRRAQVTVRASVRGRSASGRARARGALFRVFFPFSRQSGEGVNNSRPCFYPTPNVTVTRSIDLRGRDAEARLPRH
jgi:hypothetical protein